MPHDDDSAISASDAKDLFAEWKSVPAGVLAGSGGPDSVALMWLAARWRRALSRGPRLVAVTVDHGLRAESAREAREVERVGGALANRHPHAEMDRHEARAWHSGGCARGALPPAGAGSAPCGRDPHPHGAHQRRPGRDL